MLERRDAALVCAGVALGAFLTWFPARHRARRARRVGCNKGNNPTSQRSVVIVGMRGAGKTTLATKAAEVLGWKLVDLDHYFVEKHGSIKDLVAAKGWPAFRALELEVLREVLRLHPERTVIACGGGIVETEAARSLLIAYAPVVQVCKSIEDVETLLNADTGRASLGEPIRSVWERRKPLYHAVADYDFHIRQGDNDWPAIARDFGRLLQRITGQGQQPYMGDDSFFLSLTCSDVADVLPMLSDLTRDIDMLELRVDLLRSLEPAFVREQLATLRRATDTPILFTVRSKSQGGAFIGDDEEVLALNSLAVRAATEFLDVETNLAASTVQRQIEKAGVCRLIGSFHDMSRMLPAAEAAARLQACTLGGRASIAKLVLGAESAEDGPWLQQFASSLQLPMPFIALTAGDKGRMSRVLNRCMTPVTHSRLPTAAPGQMTAAEILELRRRSGYLSRKVD